ncbi:DUF2852 domain-containing protein [Labrys sp. KB_33_2]|uniref:DUF2852 domain-containing protein n=1 Tax=unclassified Labrys (in: a-proteobacteria) TaxID=2688601 RepID=UPI003EC12017
MTSCSTRGRWHPLHVVAVIAGFLIWWPLGLAALAYFIWGDRFPREKVREGFERAKAEFAGFGRDQRSYAGHGWSATGNAAFDDYRRETLRRLEEERRRLEEEGRAFGEFVTNLRRARDKEEFDRFMAERNTARNGGDSHSA